MRPLIVILHGGAVVALKPLTCVGSQDGVKARGSRCIRRMLSGCVHVLVFIVCIWFERSIYSEGFFLEGGRGGFIIENE